MRLLGWLPWVREHRRIQDERAAAEQRAAEAQRAVIEPLRAMRHYDYLTGAVQDEIRRQVGGSAG